jgi:hypothetical protein
VILDIRAYFLDVCIINTQNIISACYISGIMKEVDWMGKCHNRK